MLDIDGVNGMKAVPLLDMICVFCGINVEWFDTGVDATKVFSLLFMVVVNCRTVNSLCEIFGDKVALLDTFNVDVVRIIAVLVVLAVSVFCTATVSLAP